MGKHAHGDYTDDLLWTRECYRAGRRMCLGGVGKAGEEKTESTERLVGSRWIKRTNEWIIRGGAGAVSYVVYNIDMLR